MLDAFVAAGFNLIDTADVYSRWVPGTRAGSPRRSSASWLKRVRQAGSGRDRHQGRHGDGRRARRACRRAYILQAVGAVAEPPPDRHIDLYQSHQDDPDTPLEETLGAFGELIAQGKVRAIGASNYSAARLAEALAVSREQGPAALRVPPAATTTSATAPASKANWSRVCRAEGLGGHPLLLARRAGS